MPIQKDPWPQGTPSWVDVMVDDADAARAFYTALFGWTAEPGPPEYGGYTMCLLEGRPVAGLSPKPESWAGPNVWSTYLAVDDADAAVARAGAAGGTTVVEPMTVGTLGRMAFGADPSGAAYGIWQAMEHTGVQISNEPGSLVWNELMTRDYEAARTFYAAVFGYSYEDMGSGENFTYSTIARPDGHIVAGIGALDPNMPPEVPSHWVTYFGVADTDATAALAQRLGGTLEMAPFDSQFGRIAVIRAPQGETFSIISVEQRQPSEAEESEPQSEQAGAEAAPPRPEADPTGAGV
jgi:predicted enzyme related to lactoylglutathione lyase